MTTTETTPVTAIEMRRPRIKVIVAAFGFGLIVAAASAAAILVAYDQLHNGRVFHGVTVGTVDLSDLDQGTAAARLNEAYASYGQGTVTLESGAIRRTITYDKLGRGPDVDGLLDQAFAVGRTGTLVERALDEVRTAFKGVTLQPLAKVDPAAVLTAVTAAGATVDQPATDAAAAASPTGFTSTEAVRGRAVDEASTATAIIAALRDPATPASVTVPLSIVSIPPVISTEAAAAAKDKATTMVADVTVIAGKEKWTIKAATVQSWISFGWSGGTYGPTVDENAIRKALKPLVKEVARPAKDATFLVGKGGAIVGVTASVTGRALDVNKTASAVSASLASRAVGGQPIITPVQAALVLKTPKLTTEVAKQSAPLMRQISSWTTYYVSGPHNGFGANISIPALTISGTVVAPGQWFSFWKTVGDVSLAKGYKLGGAIVDGHSVEGHTIGGGICSCSTTLFNAALRAGFQMGARKNHFYYIKRYPKGLDATVYISDGGGAQDMTWRNDTPYPVLIKAYAVPGIVRFTLYSVPNGRTVHFTAPLVKNYRPSTTEIQYTTSLRPGVRSQVEYEAAGFDCWVTRTVRDRNGRIVHVDTYYSHYARVVGLILIGKSPS